MLVGLVSTFVGLARGTETVESALDRSPFATWANAKEKKAGQGGQIRDKRMRPGGRRTQASKRRNRRASNPLSPIAAPPLATLLAGRVSNFLPAKPKHVNPPIPLFKIPRSEWPQVARRVAQGESLRQIARSYHTSYEAVRRVLNAARKELVARQGEAALPPEDEEEWFSPE